MTVVLNDNNELIPSHTITGGRVCIDYHKMNDATRKGYFPLPFIDQMLERLSGNDCYCFLDGFLGFFQILIAPDDQEKITFTCLYGTFAYRRMHFGLCNAPATSQRCMTAIFYDMVEDFMKAFMDDFSGRDCCGIENVGIKRLLSVVEVTTAGYYFYCWTTKHLSGTFVDECEGMELAVLVSPQRVERSFLLFFGVCLPRSRLLVLSACHVTTQKTVDTSYSINLNMRYGSVEKNTMGRDSA
nr:RNA-directed DNA polymerase homolog [Tanacetum cinerariifolium]